MMRSKPISRLTAVAFALALWPAMGASGATTTSTAVAVTNPTYCQTINGGPTTLTATVGGGVAKVQWWNDGALLGTATSAPFSLKWWSQNGYNGNHTIKAVAMDASGNTLGTSSTAIVLLGASGGPATVTPTCSGGSPAPAPAP